MSCQAATLEDLSADSGTFGLRHTGTDSSSFQLRNKKKINLTFELHPADCFRESLPVQRSLQTLYLATSRVENADPHHSASACKQEVHSKVNRPPSRAHKHKVCLSGGGGGLAHLVIHSVSHDRRHLLLLGIAEGSDSQGDLQQTQHLVVGRHNDGATTQLYSKTTS